MKFDRFSALCVGSASTRGADGLVPVSCCPDFRPGPEESRNYRDTHETQGKRMYLGPGYAGYRYHLRGRPYLGGDPARPGAAGAFRPAPPLGGGCDRSGDSRPRLLVAELINPGEASSDLPAWRAFAG